MRSKKIIVSTSDEVKDFKRAETLVYKKPIIKGLFHENNHLSSIQNALQIIDNEADIVLKTRTDMRIFNELALLAIPSIHKNLSSDGTLDKSRLGLVSNNSILLKINNISDHLYIGTKRLLNMMFNLEFREFKETFAEINVNPNLIFDDKRGPFLKNNFIHFNFY